MISIFGLLNILSILPDIYNIYSKNGVINSDINDFLIRKDQFRLTFITDILERIGLQYEYALAIVIAIYICSFLFVLMNYYRLIFAIIVLVIHNALVASSYSFSYGADYMISFSLFINMLLCINSKYCQGIYSFAIRLLQLQLCIIYFFSGVGKAMGNNWYTGDAIWYLVSTYTNVNILTAFVATTVPVVFQIISLSVVIVELFYPILIYNKLTKNVALIYIIITHIIIILTINLYTFGVVMIILNVIAFQPKMILEFKYFKRNEYIAE
ncbi:hypothetical protein [Chryseobacterium sp. FH2]|uniref:hypothetical protein n=1 Tax=Chryseobacterium sp. FH2 TaxID=1674291 RepID=UPI00103C4875|nr:hypothetical protein [Chryseobacterium sp. FH2]